MPTVYTRLLELPKTSFFLFGPRATGKTTWLRQQLPEAHWCDLVPTEAYVRYLHDPGLLRREVEALPANRWVVVDEDVDWITIRPDAELDLKHLEKLLDRVANTIQTAPNRVRYVMNNFVIAVGCAVVPLSDKAIDAAQQMGVVEVFMGDTSCQVPSALAYIDKVRGMGRIGKKKKMARC